MIFHVVHEAFQTDHITTISTLVEADSAEKAKSFFNALAKERRNYPYMWSDAGFVVEAKVYSESLL